jgi:hypothetical protein
MKKIVFGLTALLLGGCFMKSADGDKVGVVTKVAVESSFFGTCPTWEAEMVRGGFSNGSGANGHPFDFTIEKEADARKLQELMNSNVEIHIHYVKKAWTFCSSESDGYFMTSFEVVNHQKQNDSIVPDTTANSGTQYNVPTDPGIEAMLKRQIEIQEQIAKALDTLASILEKQNAAHN